MLGDMQRALFSLREENKALAVDAARYRWLREHSCIAVYTSPWRRFGHRGRCG